MYILVKNLNGRLIFIMDNEVDFEVLLNELKGLLVQSFFKKKDYYPKAFFDLKGRILENLYTILQLSKCHLFIIKIMISL